MSFNYPNFVINNSFSNYNQQYVQSNMVNSYHQYSSYNLHNLHNYQYLPHSIQPVQHTQQNNNFYRYNQPIIKKQDIAKIPAIPAISAISECVICFYDLTNEYKTECGHKFDLECIYKWVTCKLSEKQGRCPCCNQFIDKNKIINKYKEETDKLLDKETNKTAEISEIIN